MTESEHTIPFRYPLFLNIENHCSYDGQGRMAYHLKEIFGGIVRYSMVETLEHVIFCRLDRLLSKTLSEESQTLPSPEQLKYKVIIRVRSTCILSLVHSILLLFHLE